MDVAKHNSTHNHQSCIQIYLHAKRQSHKTRFRQITVLFVKQHEKNKTQKKHKCKNIHEHTQTKTLTPHSNKTIEQLLNSQQSINRQQIMRKLT